MKNHIRVDGRLLQTNKKWSNLKESQKAWISEVTGAEYDKYIAEHKASPRSGEKDVIIAAVYSKIEARGIWIPYGEAERAINKFIDRRNRKREAAALQNGPPVPERDGNNAAAAEGEQR